MKKLLDYYNNEIPVLYYKLKTILEVDQNKIESFLNILQKYEPQILDVKKTILQPNSIDFPNHSNVEITTIEFSTHYPLSPYMILKEIIKVWNVPEDSVLVRNVNDQLEQQNITFDLEKEIKKTASIENLIKSSLLSTSRFYMKSEAAMPQENLAGNFFVELFKEKLNKNRENPWNFPLDYTNDFNKDIKDSPKIHHYEKKQEKLKDFDKDLTTRWGNLWHNFSIAKSYKTKENKPRDILVNYRNKK